MRVSVIAALGIAILSLGACGKHYDQRPVTTASVVAPIVAVPEKRAQMASLGPVEVFRKRISCVPYARDVSGIEIRGDAWTWWKGAERHYQRGATPAVGSVMVMKKGRKLDRGHVAMVTAIVNSREICVDHANWRHGEVHRGALVRDVSEANDWSLVQVWYPPIDGYGTGKYAVSGFIYPDWQQARK